MRCQFRETGIKSTVAIFLDNTRRTQVKAFHCTACGYVVFQYYDEQKVMVAGEGPLEPNEKPVVTMQCKNNQCKTKYDVYLGATNG